MEKRGLQCRGENGEKVYGEMERASNPNLHISAQFCKPYNNVYMHDISGLSNAVCLLGHIISSGDPMVSSV